jgi:hypothetical protein
MSPVTGRARSLPTRDGNCVEVPALSCSDKEIVHRVSRHPDVSSLTRETSQTSTACKQLLSAQIFMQLLQRY